MVFSKQAFRYRVLYMVISKQAFRYRVLYMVISGIGLLLATELLSGQFNTGFFVYYTNLSNLIAFSMMGYVVFLTTQSRSPHPLQVVG